METTESILAWGIILYSLSWLESKYPGTLMGCMTACCKLFYAFMMLYMRMTALMMECLLGRPQHDRSDLALETGVGNSDWARVTRVT